MLGHQLPRPPGLREFWATLDKVFAWLASRVAILLSPRAEPAELDPDWVAPRSMTSWRRGYPFELIR